MNLRIQDAFTDLIGRVIGEPQPFHDFTRDFRALFGMLIESQASFTERLGLGFANIMKKGRESNYLRDGRFQMGKKKSRMIEHVSLGMKVLGLLNAFHGLYFRKDFFHKPRLMKQDKSALRSFASKNFPEFLADPLRADRADIGHFFWHAVQFNFKTRHRRKRTAPTGYPRNALQGPMARMTSA